MEVAAIAKNIRISAQKARLVADLIRGLPVAKAVDVLTFSRKKAPACKKSIRFCYS